MLTFLLPLVLSDVVEIVIEYEETTSTTTTATTTTPTVEGVEGGAGAPSETTTTTVPGEVGAIITYEMPASFDVYQNETPIFTIKVNNMGTVTLHNISIHISGIPETSFSVDPSLVYSLEPGISTQFSISIESEKIDPGDYTLTISIISSEVSETTSLVLNVKEYAREIGEAIEEEKEFEEEVKPTFNVFKYLFVGVMIVACVILVIVLILYKTNRCPACGGRLKKEYESKNFVSFLCKKCGYRMMKRFKKVTGELKHDEV
jgi:predicted RNA-binding Zn-ribbon protein involved in translation (DUF1610 family)